MFDREELETLLADLRRQRQEDEAEAGHAAEAITRMVSGLTPLAEIDGEQVRAATDTFCDALLRLKAHEGHARALRRLLM